MTTPRLFGTPSNAQRAAKAARALEAYGLDDDPMAAVTDLLCDVRLYCDVRRIAFADQDRAAVAHYLYELPNRRES
jgi:hypothetical protein